MNRWWRPKPSDAITHKAHRGGIPAAAFIGQHRFDVPHSSGFCSIPIAGVRAPPVFCPAPRGSQSNGQLVGQSRRSGIAVRRAASSCFPVVPTCPTANVSFTVNGCVATRPLVLCNAFICVSFPIQLRLIFWRYLPLEGGPALNRGRPSIRQPCPSPLNRQSFHRVGRKPARKS